MGWQWGQGPWKHSPYVQVSDVLCYKQIPIIFEFVVCSTTANVTSIKNRKKEIEMARIF